MPGKSRCLGPDATLTRKRLYTLDATVGAASQVSDISGLTAVAMAAVRAGGGHVLDTSHVIFPNGAVTLVLILAESHLAIHTWPEEDLIAIDLFSCGVIDGQRVTGELIRRLALTGVRRQQLDRARPARPARPGPAQTGVESDNPN